MRQKKQKYDSKTIILLIIYQEQQQLEVLNYIEKLNVDIPINREAFNNYYWKQLKPLIQEQEIQKKQNQEDDNLSSTKDIDYTLIYAEKKRKNQNIYQEIDQLLKKQQTRTVNDKPTDYYYKRWLWVQFPWLCLSFKSDYSKKMKQCFQSTNESLSVKEESKLNRCNQSFHQYSSKVALKVAYEAKKKKMLVFSDQNNPPQPQYTEDLQQFSLIQYIPPNNQIRSNSRDNAYQNQTFDDDPYQLPIIKRDSLHKKSQNVFLTSMENPQKTKFQKIQSSQILEISSIMGKKISQRDSSLNILPKLKSKILNQSTFEMSSMVVQKDGFRKHLDQLIYQNLTLKKKHKELQTILSNISVDQNSNQMIKIRQKIIELQKDIQKNEQYQKQTTFEKNRMKIIFKICQENNSLNEEWIRNLNYLVTNLFKVISMEQKEIEQMNTEMGSLEKSQKQFDSLIKEKKAYYKSLIGIINQKQYKKQQLDIQYWNAQTSILQEVEETQKSLANENKRNTKKDESKKINNDQMKQIHSLEEKLEKYKKQYQLLSEALQINDDSEQQQKMEQIQRRTLLYAEVVDKQQYVELLKSIIIKETNELNILKNAALQDQQNIQKLRTLKSKQNDENAGEIYFSKNELKVIMASSQKEYEQKIVIQQKLDTIQSSQKLFLINLKRKMNVNEGLDQKEVFKKLLEKQALLKLQIDDDQYQMYLEGTLPFTGIYNQLIQKQSAPQDRQFSTIQQSSAIEE